MMSRETNSAGPTSFADSTTSAQCVRGFPSCSLRSMCLCRFSTITIAASIIAPIAIAIPPSDMIFASSPSNLIARIAIRIPIGSVRMATSALEAWRRKTTVTNATMIDSSTNFPRSVAIARSMSPERS